MRRFSKQSGFSMIETLIYLALLVLILGAVVASITSIARSYRTLKVIKNVETAGVFVMERMTRDIREAQSLDTTNSVFGTSTGKLVLSATDSFGYATTVEFSTVTTNGQNILHVKMGTSDLGPLTTSSTTVQSILFRQISTGKSTGVRIELQLKAVVGSITRIENFYSTVILRGSY